MSLSTSHGVFYTPDTHEALGTSANEADGRCGGASGTDIAYAFEQTSSMQANSGVRLITFRLGDGLVLGQGWLYNGIGIRPRGFVPPAFDDVLAQLVDALPEFTEQQLLVCGAEDLYQQRVETWQTSGESTMGLRFEVMGWASGYDDQPRRLSTADFAWSDVTGNYAVAGSGDGGGNSAETAQPYWNHEEYYVGADGSGGSTGGFASYRQFDGIM